MDRQGKNIILSLQRQIRTFNLISGALLAIAFSAVIIAVLYKAGWLPFAPFAATVITLTAVALSIYASPGISQTEVARFLNSKFPQLEESCELLLRPQESMNTLERLQASHVEQVLAGTPQPEELNKRLKSSGIITAVALLICFAILKVPITFGTLKHNEKTGNAAANNIIHETIPPQISGIEVLIAPPRYTQKPLHKQSFMSISAEDGATITWTIKTNIAVKSISFVFNNKQTIALRPANQDGTQWRISKTASASGFYQVSIDGKLSDFYKLEIIKDQPATIRLISPKQYSTIDFGQPQQTRLQVALADDYGIKDAYVSATVASGQGEGVKFKEQKLVFGTAFGGTQYNLQKTINLKGLGMQPGDELYFFVKALDSRGQESRSDVYFVSIQDTAQLLSMDGMVSGVSLVPEYFRSQRQIIIDTEKLLKDKDSISTETFNNRSNNLGIDQKMLRLRYGKFLGEEEESEAGGHEDAGNEESVVLGDASKLMDQYTHKHDQAEDATFFEPELKSQLKATLTEMWNSELRLRTYKPAEALPYEYKALRLLKDLQQKSRVYVAKTSAKTPVLKLEKRLTGELDKIGNPVRKRDAGKDVPKTELLRRAVSVVEELSSDIPASAQNLQVLQDANQEIMLRASRQPSVYLGAVSSMRKIIARTNNSKDIATVEAALQRMIDRAPRAPQAAQNLPNKLSDQYFKNLKMQ